VDGLVGCRAFGPDHERLGAPVSGKGHKFEIQSGSCGDAMAENGAAGDLVVHDEALRKSYTDGELRYLKAQVRARFMLASDSIEFGVIFNDFR
jgi:hypothetical protein